jgi:hypothetical protein
MVMVLEDFVLLEKRPARLPGLRKLHLFPLLLGQFSYTRRDDVGSTNQTHVLPGARCSVYLRCLFFGSHLVDSGREGLDGWDFHIYCGYGLCQYSCCTDPTLSELSLRWILRCRLGHCGSIFFLDLGKHQSCVVVI